MSRVVVVTDGVQGPPGPGVIVRTTAEWEANDKVLARGRAGYDEDTATLKIGDGSSTWSELPSISGDGSGGSGSGGHLVANGIVGADVDLVGGNFTEVDLLSLDGVTVEAANVPRSMGVGVTVLSLSGPSAGLWRITASGPCERIPVLGGEQVVASLYAEATATFFGMNNNPLDPTAPATLFVREAVIGSQLVAGYGLDVSVVDDVTTFSVEKRRPIPSITAGYHDGTDGDALLAHAAGDPDDVRLPAVSDIDGIELTAPRVAGLGGQPTEAHNGFWEVFEVQPNGTNHPTYLEVDDFGGSSVEPGDIYFHRVHQLNGRWEADSLFTGTPVHVGSGDKYGNSIIFTANDGMDCNFTTQVYPYDNTASGLNADTLPEAVDEVAERAGSMRVAFISGNPEADFGGSFFQGVWTVGMFSGLPTVGNARLLAVLGANPDEISGQSSGLFEHVGDGAFVKVRSWNTSDAGLWLVSKFELAPGLGSSVAWLYLIGGATLGYSSFEQILPIIDLSEIESSIDTLENRLNRYHPVTPVVPHLHVSKYVTFDPDFPLDGTATHVGGQAIEDGQNLTILNNSDGNGGVWTLHLNAPATRATGFGSMLDTDIGNYDHVSYTGTRWAYCALFRLYGDPTQRGMTPVAGPSGRTGITGGEGVSRSYRPDWIATDVVGNNLSVLNANGTTTNVAINAQTGTFCVLVLDDLSLLTIHNGAVVMTEHFDTADGVWIAGGWNAIGGGAIVATNGQGAYVGSYSILSGSPSNAVTVSAGYDVSAGDYITVDTALTTLVLQLPSATVCPGRSIKVRVAATGGVVRLDAQSGETVDGAADYEITAVGTNLEVTSNGSDWDVTSVYVP
jgi:hypothetical protein